MDELETAAEQLAYEAAEVKLLLEKDAVKRAFASTRARIVRQWEKSETPEAREAAFAKLKAFAEWQLELRALTERLHPKKE